MNQFLQCLQIFSPSAKLLGTLEQSPGLGPSPHLDIPAYILMVQWVQSLLPVLRVQRLACQVDLQLDPYLANIWPFEPLLKNYLTHCSCCPSIWQDPEQITSIVQSILQHMNKVEGGRAIVSDNHTVPGLGWDWCGGFWDACGPSFSAWHLKAPLARPSLQMCPVLYKGLQFRKTVHV